MVFHWSLSDSKSPEISRTLLSILAVINNTVFWIVPTRPLISKFSNPRTDPLVTVTSAPNTICITVTFMFHSFFSSLARSKYLSLFSLSFSYTLWSAGIAKSTIRQGLSLSLSLSLSLFLSLSPLFCCCCLLTLGPVVCPRLDDLFVSQNAQNFLSYFPGQILGCAYTICSYGQI